MTFNKVAMQSLPDEVRKQLQQHQQGQELMSITSLPGWTALLNLLNEEVAVDEKKLMGYRESDPNQLFRLHAELQGKRKLILRLESQVRFLTGLVTDPPASIQKYVNL